MVLSPCLYLNWVTIAVQPWAVSYCIALEGIALETLLQALASVRALLWGSFCVAASPAHAHSFCRDCLQRHQSVGPCHGYCVLYWLVRIPVKPLSYLILLVWLYLAYYSFALAWGHGIQNRFIQLPPIRRCSGKYEVFLSVEEHAQAANHTTLLQISLRKFPHPKSISH